MIAPSMVDGKHRRPIGMRADMTAYDPREDREPDQHGQYISAAAFFEYREDALAAGKEWVESQGYEYRAQYIGRYDLWVLFAKRKSWSHEILVEACINAAAVVTKHAHVPYRFRYIGEDA